MRVYLSEDGGDGGAAVAEKPAKKTAVTKVAGGAGKKVTKKAVKKAAPKKEAKESGPSIRLRVFQALNKNSNGLTGAQIAEKLELHGIPSLLKDEGMRAKNPRIAREVREGVRGVVYVITAAGKQALKDETVDTEAAESAAGKEWPNNR